MTSADRSRVSAPGMTASDHSTTAITAVKGSSSYANGVHARNQMMPALVASSELQDGDARGRCRPNRHSLVIKRDKKKICRSAPCPHGAAVPAVARFANHDARAVRDRSRDAGELMVRAAAHPPSRREVRHGEAARRLPPISRDEGNPVSSAVWSVLSQRTGGIQATASQMRIVSESVLLFQNVAKVKKSRRD